MDGVPAPPPLDVDRLVEVHGALGVEGEEREVGAVELRQGRAGRGVGGGLLHLGREVARKAQLLLHRPQRRPHRRRARPDADGEVAGHAPTLGDPPLAWSLVLILLPPSEGKAAPGRGRPLDLGTLSMPSLTPARRKAVDALVSLCRSDPEHAGTVLGLSRTQLDLVARNAGLAEAPTARADRIYTGVLYDALDASSLSAAAKRRAASRVAVTSSLFGLVRFGDRIPAYRLSGDATVPGLGQVAGWWREALGPAVTEALGRGLLVDLRSSTYAAFWRPPAELASRVATVRVLHEVGGRRQVVSHFNKATKGRLVRAPARGRRRPALPGRAGRAAPGARLDRRGGRADEEGHPARRRRQRALRSGRRGQTVRRSPQPAGSHTDASACTRVCARAAKTVRFPVQEEVMKTMSYTESRARYAEVLDSVVNDREEVVITRAGHEPVVLMSLADFESLRETAYLMRSPANARRLLDAMERLEAGHGEQHTLVDSD
ncbi:peroxide stress protein YaaA [Nocardioides sp. TF02-7]|uniref:peroxide stress protein YaaA n=1 Tax=Nocardioides sp. TF02-7 TaxID=2917724 RepID=UPI001F06855A|nr:peroxide stress protein YaaA [Nocardioides sp. TF02-7]UMG94967.1 peroxide stress protein YaaA [Nocardioides sp. TF02-7]